MNPINLFSLTRVSDVNTFALFEKVLSGRSTQLKAKEHEMKCLVALVDAMLAQGAQYESFDCYYYSYDIPQIGKEFDLLRVSEDKVVNIELKSQGDRDAIKEQLKKNRHYLSHLARKMSLFAFVESTQAVYRLLDDDTLEPDSMSSIAEVINYQRECFSSDINTLFKVSNFLVSPLNTPERFLRKEYFLTSQQQEIRKEVIEQSQSATAGNFAGITGGAGTGKTLLLYDLAVQCSTVGRCCLIHCGVLSDGHSFLSRRLGSAINILSAKEAQSGYDFSSYRYIFVDEAHRFYKHQFDLVVERAKQYSIFTVFSYDTAQTLSMRERDADIGSQIAALPDCLTYKLSSKIRTNKELASFIRRILHLNSPDTHPRYPSVSVRFANDAEEAKIMICDFRRSGYTFINYTSSNYYASKFDSFSGDFNTHRVIGQEFDKVLMLMNDTFSYDENGRLVGRHHPNPDYVYRQLLYQGLTRVREKLAVIIIGNRPLFENILSILQ
jgi:hypothetical protein